MSLGRIFAWTSAVLILGAVVASSLALRHVHRAVAAASAVVAAPHRSSETRWRQEPQDYYRHLRSLGLSENETKPLVLAMLESASDGDAQRHAARYWRDDRADVIRDALARLHARESVRAQLRKIYGTDAAKDRSFKVVFRPLAERLDFLTSEQQIRLQQLHLERALEESKAARTPRLGLVGIGYRVSSDARAPSGEVVRESHDWTAGIDEILGERLGLEVQLRESPLAEQLRNCGVELSEPEFRETYRLLAALSEQPDVETYRETRAALRSLLGSDRFDRLWASRDPVFAVVYEMMRGRGIAEPTIFAAYGVMNRTQDELTEAAQMNAYDPARAIDLARTIGAKEKAALSELVGAEFARRLLTAKAQASFERSQASRK